MSGRRAASSTQRLRRRLRPRIRAVPPPSVGAAGSDGQLLDRRAVPSRRRSARARARRASELLARPARSVSSSGAPAVPAVEPLPSASAARVLHEGDAPALDRVGDDDLRPVRRTAASASKTSLERGARSWPSQRRTCQPKARNLRLEVAEVADLRRPVVGLDLVVVDDDDQSRRGRWLAADEQRLPDLALLQLAVAGQDEDAAAAPGQPLGPGHPLRLRDAHAERAGVGLDVRACRRRDGRASPPQPAQLMQLSRRAARPSPMSTAYSAGTSWPLDEKKTSRSRVRDPDGAACSSR